MILTKKPKQIKKIENLDRTCPKCNGSGMVATSNGVKACPQCHGTGRL